MIDYRKLVDELSVERVKSFMYELGAEEVIEKPGYFITNTICHNLHGGSLKLYYYYDTHLFVCYTSCGTMSIFNFLKEYYKTRSYDYDWYYDIYLRVKKLSNYVEPNFYEDSINSEDIFEEVYQKVGDKYIHSVPVQLPQYPKGILNVFTKYYPTEWLNDGISKAAMDKFNILYSISQNKIIIPHYDIDGRLVGIRGRALNTWEVENIGKYLPVRIEQTWYKHPLSLNLYGLYENKENIRRAGYVIVYEAEKSVLQSESFSIPNCSVAVCGSNFNKFQLKILMRSCQPQEIILAFDKEELPHEDKYFNKLMNICKKYSSYTNFSFIYDMENLLELKDSPTDKGEQIFKQLLEKRIRYNKE